MMASRWMRVARASGGSVGFGAGGATSVAARSDAAGGASLAAVFSGPSAVRGPTLVGGVLVPSPELVLRLVTDSSGELTRLFRWPTTTTSGFELYFQAWVVDPAGPRGFAASNGLLAKQP